MICASKQTENYSKEENNLLFKKLCCFFIHIFQKVVAIYEFFTARCLGVRFEIFSTSFVWSSIHSISIFFFGIFLVDLVIIFNKGREQTFEVSLQNRKTCVCIKYLILVRPRKSIAVNFIFYTRCKMDITPV